MLSTLASKLFNNVVKFGTLPGNNSLLHTSQILSKKKSKFDSKKKSGKSEKSKKPKKVAVILAGCGAQDGTEIMEAVSIAIHLSQKGMIPKFYAPNVDICGMINHLTQEVDTCSPPRNALVEAARIARSKIKPLCKCNTCDKAAVILPGGLGAARTLSDFESKGSQCIVHPEVESILKEFKCQCKPIGSLCIASAVMARVFCGATVTLGNDCPADRWPYAKVIEKVKQMGAKVEKQDVKGVTYCKKYNLYSNPAWLDAKATYAEVHEGIGKLITKMKEDM